MKRRQAVIIFCLMQSLSGYNFTKIKHIGVSQYLLHEEWIMSADNAQNVHRLREDN